ncbi:Myosin-XV, partial [Aphelenchoides avenae]
ANTAELAALMHQADPNNKTPDVALGSVPSLVPKTMLERSNIALEQWVSRIQAKLDAFPADIIPHRARQLFLEKIEKWQLFGAAFYFVRRVVTHGVDLAECVIAVNKNGLRILANGTHELVAHYSLSQIESASQYALSDTTFLEVKLMPGSGSAHSKSGTVTIETELGAEISRLIGQYLYLQKDAKEPIYVQRETHATG